MKKEKWPHACTSIIVSLSLLLQFIVPVVSPVQATAGTFMETTAVSSRDPYLLQNAPDALDPLRLSRVQSRYQAGDSLTITYTVSNDALPSLFPHIPDGATITDTVAILAAIEPTDDVNTLHQVALENTLLPGVSYLDSSFPPAQNGNTLTWELPDIAPGQTEVLTLTVQPPATAPDFMDLDSGAQATAVIWDRAVTHTARPASLAPNTVPAAALQPTIDVDLYDADMLWKSADFTQDPLAAFAYVRGMTYEPYQGALRGTRGTLWSAAGNSADQASLLIAMLRAAGTPARYRHGSLDTADAQTLIASMFPPVTGVAGHVPPGTDVADPLNDPALLALTQDHWWVEAYLPGQGWTDLDPSFPDAAVGQLFATPANDGTDHVAALPDDIHHTLTFHLIVEQYSSFPIGGVFLHTTEPLSATLPTAQVAGKQVVLSQFVTDNLMAGGVYANRQITYQPYLTIKENNIAFLGDPFEDFLSNFPLSTAATTAVWLEYTITTPDGHSETFQRTVKDLIGPDVRMTGGVPEFTIGTQSPPFLTPEEQYVHWVLPNDVPEWAYHRRAVSLLPTILNVAEQAGAILQVAAELGEEYTPEQVDVLVGAVGQHMLAKTEGLALTGLNFARQADTAVNDIETGLQTRLYYSEPRLFAVGSTLSVSETMKTTVDLRTTRSTAVVAPGQSLRAAHTAQWFKGLIESQLEGAALEQAFGVPAVTTYRVFEAMAAAGIEPVLIHPNDMFLLDVYPYSPQAKAYMTAALLAGKTILAPAAPVVVDGAPVLAWWEIDPVSGETISVGEDGLHIAAVSYRLIEQLVEQIVTSILEFLLNLILDSVSGGWLTAGPDGDDIASLAQALAPIGENLQSLFFNIADVLDPSVAARLPQGQTPLGFTSWSFLPAHQCPIDNCGIGQFLFANTAAAPIPLPDMWFVHRDPATAVPIDTAFVPAAATQPPGDPAFTVAANPATSTTPPGTAVTFQVDITTNFTDLFTTTVYAPDAWTVTINDGGHVSARPAANTAPGDYLLLLVSQATLHSQLSATAVHTVTVNAVETMSLALVAEPNLTVPMGQAAFTAVSNQTNDAAAEIPDAAYTVILTNSATTTHTYDVTVSGPTAGWVILNGARQAATAVTLPPGTTARIGLAIQPDPTAVPAPGLNFPVNVTATAQDNPALTASDSELFAMPGQPFNFVTIAPTTLYLSPNGSGDFSLTMQNVSNQSGSFPVAFTSPLTAAQISNLQSPISLNVGETHTQTPTISVGNEAPHGRFPFTLSSPAPGSYTQYALGQVFVLTENAGAVAAAATCDLGQTALLAALQSLALAVDELEVSCQAGSCADAAKDQTLTTLDSVIHYADITSPHLTGGPALQNVAADLAAHTDPADILADLAALAAAADQLGLELCELEEHQPDAHFTPYLEAVLLGDTAVLTLTVQNQGHLATTYAVTVTTPSGDQSFNPTIAPGDTAVLPISTTPASLGSYDITAGVVPTGPDVQMVMTDTAVARLNVVDKFVQVTAVAADPPFVETGTSSTDLSVTVANVAGIRQDVTAHVDILAPDGSSQWSHDLPLTLLIGNPRVYDLATVDTSGWAAGVYTLTVDLGVSEGVGLGYLGVGQGLGMSHSVTPLLVPPGTVTVTTVITTQLLAETILPPPAAPALVPWPERAVLSNQDSVISEQLPVEAAGGAQLVIDDRLAVTDSQNTPSTTWAITRTEDSEAAVTYMGAWTAVTNSTADHASHGDYHYAQTTGDYASFSFNGTWVAVGLATSTQSGYAELFVDGASQGLVDLYSRSNDVKRVTLSGLADTSHVITVTVTGIQNPFSTNDRVAVDYFDTWDGTDMPMGAFEQDNGRVWLSDGWVNQNDANASGGSYYRNGHTAWFPFTGDSITLQAMTYSNSEKMAVYLDDDFQGYLDLLDFSIHTKTLTFDGLAAGPHMLTVRTFRGQATIDLFTTPATEPAIPPSIGSFHRTEEYDPAILYNGYPFAQTSTTWVSDFNDVVSDHYTYRSGNPGDTAVFTFTGVSAAVGFYAERRGGYAEIFLDGVSQGVVDTYRRDPTVLPVTFDNLANTSHTLTIEVLGQANPLATADNVYLDYIDVWDGAPLPDGTFEELDGRLYRSFRWTRQNDAQASGGYYLQDAITGAANVWFPFTGDSITFRTMASAQGSQWTKVRLDGQPLATINLYSNTTVSRTYSFTGLGNGLHVLQLERFRGELMIDAFMTPGVPPFTQMPVYTGVVRYEEDDPALLYNGFPYAQRPQSWDEQFQGVASGGYTSLSSSANDTISLTFDGRWASVGFFTHQYGGQAEIFVDGVSQGSVGLYSANSDVKSFTVGNLITGTHTLSITVLGLPDPPSTQARVHLDYIDIWDGQPMPDDTINASQVVGNGRVHASTYLNTVSHPNAINGDYLVNSAGNPETNTWYAFTGDSFTFYGFSINFGTSLMDVFVDGQFIETVDVVYPFSTQPLAYHYDGLGDGPHVVRISNNVGSRIDAFASNQPPINYQPLAEWWESDRTAGGSIFGGIHVPAAVGDVTGDGRPELVVASSNWDHQGELFLMNGDGRDAGDGTPIIWSVPFDIFNGFEDVGAPAIAELDGQPGAEIVMATIEGMYAFHSDGSTYWFTDTVQPHVFFGTPAIGNLDLDAEPEIVINMDDTMVVFEQDGAIAWTFNDPDGLTMPLLADLTGDGLLDILFHDGDDTLYLYDYNLGNPQLVWTAVFANPPHAYGAPAVADLDGDGVPEAAVATENWLYALNSEDGSVQWSAPLDPGRTGGVTIADIDGDGAVELVTSSLFNGGTLYAFEADGTLKWSAAALDSSPLNTSAADLDGDGAYELLWNGNGQGFTIYDGRTGAILFNEPLAVSATGSDVPVAADVDLDGFAEVVVPAQTGIRVFGFDGVWGPARPLWNQLNYHITNIEDDLTVPFNEVSSWDVHNTYRAQTDLVHPLPTYQVALTHTAAVTGVMVLPGTFNVPPTSQADPLYGWDYSQNWTNPVVTRTFQSQVSSLQPGETRRVAEGSLVAYTLSSGANVLALPPLYVTAARLAHLDPATQTKPVGSTAVYTLTLTNLSATPGTYTTTVSGPLAGWTAGPTAVTVPANSEATVPLTLTIPVNASPQTLPLFVRVANEGGTGSATEDLAAELVITDGLNVAITPAAQMALSGETVTYTLTITNLEAVGHTYTVIPSGLADVALPGSFYVPAGQTADFAFTASAAGAGPRPFTLLVTSPSGAADSADAVLDVAHGYGVGLAWSDPPNGTAVAGQGTPTIMAFTLTNLGDLPDTYDLNVMAPTGWGMAVMRFGQPVTQVTLPPGGLNSQTLQLVLTPPVSAVPGVVPVSVTAHSPRSQATLAGSVQVLNLGVTVTFLSGPAAIEPTDTAVWQVQVTNQGDSADTYDLGTAGPLAPFATFSQNTVTLNPGQSQTVQLTATGLEHLLPQVYDVVASAQSQANTAVLAQDVTSVAVNAYQAVDLLWLPVSQTVTDTLTASFTLVVTNDGNVDTTYNFTVEVPGGSAVLELPAVYLPAHAQATLRVDVGVPGGGTYLVTGTAVSADGSASASAVATLIVIGEPPPPPPPDNLVLYLPIVLRP